jgi:hypothetical protein
MAAYLDDSAPTDGDALKHFMPAPDIDGQEAVLTIHNSLCHQLAVQDQRTTSTCA